MLAFLLGYFFSPFITLTAQRKQNFKKKKKRKKSWRYHNFTQLYQNHDHMLYCSWDLLRDGCNCYFYSGLFLALLPPQPPSNPKNENLKKVKKEEKRLEISLHTSVPKAMIICYTVPETWCVTDVIIVHFGLFFALLSPNSLKNQNQRGNWQTIAQISIWKCGLEFLDLDTQLKSLELQWILRFLNLTNALRKGLMLYWLNLKNNSNQNLCSFRQKQILSSSRHKKFAKPK